MLMECVTRPTYPPPHRRSILLSSTKGDSKYHLLYFTISSPPPYLPLLDPQQTTPLCIINPVTLRHQHKVRPSTPVDRCERRPSRSGSFFPVCQFRSQFFRVIEILIVQAQCPVTPLLSSAKTTATNSPRNPWSLSKI